MWRILQTTRFSNVPDLVAVRWFEELRDNMLGYCRFLWQMLGSVGGGNDSLSHPARQHRFISGLQINARGPRSAEYFIPSAIDPKCKEKRRYEKMAQRIHH